MYQKPYFALNMISKNFIYSVLTEKIISNSCKRLGEILMKTLGPGMMWVK